MDQTFCCLIWSVFNQLFCYFYGILKLLNRNLKTKVVRFRFFDQLTYLCLCYFFSSKIFFAIFKPAMVLTHCSRQSPDQTHH